MVGEINTPYDMLGISETETEIQTPTEKLVDFQETVEEGGQDSRCSAETATSNRRRTTVKWSGKVN